MENKQAVNGLNWSFHHPRPCGLRQQPWAVAGRAQIILPQAPPRAARTLPRRSGGCRGEGGAHHPAPPGCVRSRAVHAPQQPADCKGGCAARRQLCWLSAAIHRGCGGESPVGGRGYARGGRATPPVRRNDGGAGGAGGAIAPLQHVNHVDKRAHEVCSDPKRTGSATIFNPVQIC